MTLGVALPLAERLLANARSVPGVEQADLAGSIRRKHESIGDVDLLIVYRNSATTLQTLVKLPQVKQVLGVGDTRAFRPQSVGATAQRREHLAVGQASTLAAAGTHLSRQSFRLTMPRPVVGKTWARRALLTSVDRCFSDALAGAGRILGKVYATLSFDPGTTDRVWRNEPAVRFVRFI